MRGQGADRVGALCALPLPPPPPSPRLTKLLRSGGGGGVEGGAQVPPMSVSALLGVVLPLLQQLVVEGKSAEDSGEWRGGGVGG